MAKKQDAPMSQAQYDAMVERMIQLVNRGRQSGMYVKMIAKAGDVTPVLDYINKMHKYVVKYTQQTGQQQPAPTLARAQRGSKRRRGQGAVDGGVQAEG